MVRFFQSSAWLAFFWYVSIASAQISSEPSAKLEDFEGIREEAGIYTVSVPFFNQVLRTYPESMVGNRNAELALKDLEDRITAEEQRQTLRSMPPYSRRDDKSELHTQNQRNYLDFLRRDKYAQPHEVAEEYIKLINSHVDQHQWSQALSSSVEGLKYAEMHLGTRHWLWTELRTKERLVEHLRTLSTDQLDLYDSLVKLQYDYVADWKRLRSGVETAKALLGESNLLVATLLRRQAETMAHESDPAIHQARLAALLEGVRVSKLATENWHPQYADACVALANYYDQNSLRDEAEKLLIQCLDLFRQDIDTSIDFGRREWELNRLITLLEVYAKEHVLGKKPEQAVRNYEAIKLLYISRHGHQSWQVIENELDLKQAVRLSQSKADTTERVARIKQFEKNASELRKEDYIAYKENMLEALAMHADVYGYDPRYYAKVYAEIAEVMFAGSLDQQALDYYQLALKALAVDFKMTTYRPLEKMVDSFMRMCHQMSQQQLQRGDMKQAVEACELEISVLNDILGLFHWQVLDRRQSLSEVIGDSLADDEQRKKLQEAQELIRGIDGSSQNSDTNRRAMMKDVNAAFQIYEKTLGADHTRTVELANKIAREYEADGHFDRAEEMYQRVVSSHRRKFGLFHPRYADALNSLADLFQSQGEQVKSKLLSLKATAIARRVGRSIEYQNEARTRTIIIMGKPAKERHRQLRESLKALTDSGSYLTALPISQQDVELSKAVNGEQHREFAVSLGNRASLLTNLGDYAQAEQLYLQAKIVFESETDAKDLDGARNLHNLAVLYEKQRLDAKALPFIQRELQLFEAAGDTNSIDYAQSLGTLGSLQQGLGQKNEAERQYTKSLSLLEKQVTPKHQLYLDSIDNIGVLSVALGKLDQAQDFLQRAFDGRKESFGEKHQDCAESLHNLAVLHEVRADHDKANALYRVSLDITWGNLEQASLTQSHRQQISAAAALRRILDSYLAFAVRSPPPPAQVYQQILRWKGAAFTRRQQLISSMQNDAFVQLVRELDQTTENLSSLALQVPWVSNWPQWQTDIKTLTERKEALEQQLIERYSQLQTASSPIVSVEQIRKSLPDNGTLVDIIQYRDVSWGPNGTGDRNAPLRLTAFIVPRQGDIQQVDLGPADPIDQTVAKWRASFGQHDSAETTALGIGLRRAAWEPIEKYLLPGTVFIAPDGSLTLFPFAALPGKQPGSFLIEERAVATVPVPQVLPSAVAGQSFNLNNPSLLAIGNVDYSALAGGSDDTRSSSASTLAPLRHWQRIDGTRDELYIVRGLFEDSFTEGDCRILPGRLGSETAVRDQAPKYHWLHIATHGFFAEDIRTQLLGDPKSSSRPSEAVWDLALFAPEVLSGIVLAGANGIPSGTDDGLLTALEVAQMNLSDVDTAVLSACETGLGELQPGEGVLSLQRAFHLAGAHTVVSSLWKVNDRTTQQLMADFYTNVWQKKMTKVDALRAAQIAMLNTGAARGLGPPLDGEVGNKRLSPYYWAAFVLSGDWR